MSGNTGFTAKEEDCAGLHAAIAYAIMRFPPRGGVIIPKEDYQSVFALVTTIKMCQLKVTLTGPGFRKSTTLLHVSVIGAISASASYVLAPLGPVDLESFRRNKFLVDRRSR